ncbi:MAG: carbohydrate binding domain-containing protein [Treponema sp.]|nr:carbohydrate binding domain-containing protein [Treponema sp.]
MKIKSFLLAVGLLMIGKLCFCQNMKDTEGAFTFNVLDMDENSPVSCMDLNREITDESPFVKVGIDGHLYAGSERIRLFGTNISAFPEKNQAERNAKSLADRGYNVIRFHHTDASWTNCFLKYSNGKSVIDPVGLDKFDYFVYYLRKYGIYTNLNLLTGRTYTEKDGMPSGTDKIPDWKNRHLIGFWNDKARNLQKDYAKTLLEHVNPYTGLALKDDPALIIIEINNEQGMIHSYLGNGLNNCPDVLWDELEIKWNEWLKNHNLDKSVLEKKYNETHKNGKILVDSNSRWNLEQHEGAKASFSDNGSTKIIDIKKNGTQSWHVQFNTPKLQIDEEKVYTVSFKAKASKKCDFNLSVMMAHDPWSGLGFNKKVTLDTKWNEYTIILAGLKSDSNARLNIGELGFLSGTKIEFQNLKMSEGGNIEAVKTSKNGIEFPRPEVYSELPEGYKNLVLNFLYDVEKDYWTDMRDFIREELSCSALLMGSAMGNVTTGISCLFDIIDSHAYFNHPVFPGNDWDMGNFYVKNDSLSRQKNSQTLTNLAQYRVFGKPFSVSEYDHPYPNQYSAEMYPMLAAFASYQDWDAVYTFNSEIIESDESKNNKITGYFDQTHNPVKAAAAPLAARIFRTWAIKPASTAFYKINLDEKKERDSLHKFGSWGVGKVDAYDNFDAERTFTQRTGIIWENKDFNLEPIPERVEESSSIYRDENTGTFYLSTKDAFIFVGNSKSKVPENENFSFRSDGNFASVMGVRLDDGKWIFYAASWSGNKGELLREYGKEKSYSSGQNVIQRDFVKLTSKPPYASKDAVALSVSGILNLNSESMHFSLLDNKGMKFGKIQDGNHFEFKETSGTLWYILEP